MPQLAIGELSPCLDAGEDLPHSAAEVLEAQLGEVRSREVADLHRQRFTFVVDNREAALVAVVAVVFLRVVGRGRARVVQFRIGSSMLRIARSSEASAGTRFWTARCRAGAEGWFGGELLAPAPAAARALLFFGLGDAVGVVGAVDVGVVGDGVVLLLGGIRDGSGGGFLARMADLEHTVDPIVVPRDRDAGTVFERRGILG